MASTRDFGGAGTPVDDQSLGELVATVTRDLSTLIHGEVELAKTEITESAKRAGLGAGLLGGAGFVGLFALLFASAAGAYGIADGGGIPVWAGFLCIGFLYGMLGAALGGLGLTKLTGISAPKRTIRTVKDDIAWAKNPTHAPPSTELTDLRESHRSDS